MSCDDREDVAPLTAPRGGPGSALGLECSIKWWSGNWSRLTGGSSAVNNSLALLGFFWVPVVIPGESSLKWKKKSPDLWAFFYQILPTVFQACAEVSHTVDGLS